MIDRKTEIRRLLKLSPEQVRTEAGPHLVVCRDVYALHKRFAEDIAQEIRENNIKDKQTRLILPVGPTAQYPILADIINNERISLSRCWFFFMDEYCDQDGRVLASNHPLSFKGIAERVFLSRLNDACGLPSEHVIFPSENAIRTLATDIDVLGGIDTCYGGIGIHGHVAFNEPEPGIKESGPRLVRLNDFTVTMNAVRSQVGGNIECFPREAYTLGMRQILASKKIRLYCRNGCEFDWANTVLRLALFGTTGDDYPVTHIRESDFRITTDLETLAPPMNSI